MSIFFNHSKELRYKTRFSRFIFIRKVWFDGENTSVYFCLYSGIDIYRVDINFILGRIFFKLTQTSIHFGGKSGRHSQHKIFLLEI